MILFPNAKINIGLEVVRKRPDNFHDIETVFYPVSLSDILEINPSKNTTLTVSGLLFQNEDPESNLVMKAYRLMSKKYNLPPVQIHLHKQIPSGAGLGGGSSDAAFTLMGLNALFSLGIIEAEMVELAANLGSDCAFFVLNRPVFATEKGNVFSPVETTLKQYKLVLVKPPFGVSTAEAYSGVKPALPRCSLKEAVTKPVDQWKESIFNRFEESVFPFHPEIGKIKDTFLNHGALYAAMSGSGSTVYGIFETVPDGFKKRFEGYFYHEEICIH